MTEPVERHDEALLTDCLTITERFPEWIWGVYISHTGEFGKFYDGVMRFSGHGMTSREAGHSALRYSREGHVGLV